MRLVLKLISVFIAAHLITACATTAPGQLSTTQAEEIKTIGVVSIAGSKFFDDRVGFTAFGNDLKTYDISDWGLDDLWERQLVDTVTAYGGYDVVQLSADREKLEVAYEKDESSIFAQYRTADFTKISDETIALARENNVDVLLVLASGAAELPSTNQVLEGLGFSSRGGLLGLTPPSHIYFVGYLHLVDGKTGKVVASRLLNENQGLFGGAYALFEVLPDTYKNKRFNELSDDDIAFVKDRLEKGLDPDWTPTVSKLLTPR